ncbi:iron-sulfur cluster assembly protein NAR1 NDAI_0F03910 [Naumovozyma dairenensis CBS 421]|uniref:Cytosolic Fe-S cluster assembly factor NAR1 n=1 Tax=Naumovozyma dairenensis (strain ATCC 10597 / BCRC 20456 / CBS 421 / NBRC 0211 / NRRL Y-12639) TaxID=1071378 RepID=G0WD48_NAUDC|nr:hypothetical protein NDAI_0F03910 [Naumovozyma dairenensis CBS 421]CCD25709.1 hypothetical protein NDAI_0F03910 [Naumovozyma dairenensis CBS 421]
MSTLLSEEDLNDFISPALACTKPTVINKEPVNVNDKGEYEVSKEPTELEKVSITLSDCLACSGCITSSEEIMLSRQSYSVFLNDWKKLNDLPADKEDNETVNNKKKILCVSIAPQCRISLADNYDMSIEEFDLCFMNFIKNYFQGKYVVGTQMGRNLTISRTNDKLIALKKEGKLDERPMLSAICPGFVIYTEKTKPNLVPLLLNVKSPQQITGSLLMDSLAEDEQMYHLTLMPCFDKKLEASRPDGENEVHCVITPKEFVSMLEELEVDFNSYRIQDENLFYEMSPEGWDPRIHWSSNSGSSSGGYAYQYILEMQNLNPGTKILEIPGKNSNVVEYRLIDPNDINRGTIASSAELSGFRNIQNMVRNLDRKSIKNNGAKRKIQVLRKRNTSTQMQKLSLSNNSNAINKPLVADPYKTDYIEVNASPGGCINGGGLINNEQSTVRKRALAQELSDKYSKSFNLVDPIKMGRMLDETSKSGSRPYEYEFHAVEQDQEKDLVTVGNTW